MSFTGWIIVGLLLVCPFYGAAQTTVAPTAETGKIFRQRQPRNFINLAAMVFEATRHNPWEFMQYGRWCGVGGEGQPVDAIDTCCQRHDICYDIAARGVCNSKDKHPYIYPYEWSVTKEGRIICDTVDLCGETLCACDKMIADCFKRHEKSYNPAYHNEELPLKEAVQKLFSRN